MTPSDADLDAIEARLASERLVSPVLDQIIRCDVPALLAALRDARAETAELRARIEALAVNTTGPRRPVPGRGGTE